MSLLGGWKRTNDGHGVVIKLQLADNASELAHRIFQTVHVELNDDQLCSLARELKRAARERGFDPWAHERPVRQSRKPSVARLTWLDRIFGKPDQLRLTDQRSSGRRATDE
jgi:predicted TIM-barrel fold metal-dependent hydrolase